MEIADDRQAVEFEAVDPRLDFLLNLRASIEAGIAALEDNVRLRRDEEYWRRKYQELLGETIKHNDVVTGNMLRLALGRFDRE